LVTGTEPTATMRHYHGTPITPATAAVEAYGGGNALVSFPNQQDGGLALAICQSVIFDNGAFPAWKSGKTIHDWQPFYDWVGQYKRHPAFHFAIIPDVIDGDEDVNDALVNEWPHERHFGAPVWHMHESLDRLLRMAHEWQTVCIGSSGSFATVGNPKWWARISQAMDAVCGPDGYPICKLHGLRMLNPKVFTKLPFASADSTNIARNIGIDKRWKTGSYPPPTKESRARLMRQRIEHYQGAERWDSEL
jgi:hypothetical protein